MCDERPKPEPQKSSFDAEVIFRTFPTDPDLFLPDVAALAEAIQKLHGPEEWRLCVLTNAIHHHLGIYALVGAKMGLKAREVLGAGFGSLQVVSFAGSEPPVSCFNDGLQVSTGSTLGHGNIRVAVQPPVRVEAQFRSTERAIRMSLRPEYKAKIPADLARCIGANGNLTPEYFSAVRSLALNYWLEWSRHELFACEPLGN